MRARWLLVALCWIASSAQGAGLVYLLEEAVGQPGLQVVGYNAATGAEVARFGAPAPGAPGAAGGLAYGDGLLYTTSNGFGGAAPVQVVGLDPLTGQEAIRFGSPFSGGAGASIVHVPTIVPVPAAAWLFGSALAGLAWLRRR